MEIEVKDNPFVKCPHCGRALIEGRWTKSKGKKALYSYIEKTVLADNLNLQRISPENALEQKMPKKIILFFSSKGDNEDIDLQIPIKAKNKICEICQKSQGQYFEGFLQLRNASSEQIEAAKKLVLEKGAIKKERIKSGNADFTLSSNKSIIYTIKELSKKYNGISNVTSTLHTKDKLTSKELHRVTGLFKFIDLKKEDIVMHEDDYYFLLGIDKKKINLQLLSKKVHKKSIPISSYDSLQNINTFETTILRDKPVLMILDENYQPQPALAFGKLNKKSKKIRAVRTKEGLFLLS